MSTQLLYFLPRLSFVATHAVFVVWLNFMLNDPFNLGLPALDGVAVASGKCVSFDFSALQRNVLTFLLVWWAPHSILARKAVKQAIGTWNSAWDRVIFATIAPFAWLGHILLWKPVSTCNRFDPLSIPVSQWAVHGIIFALASLVLLGLFYLLPSHVFGTDRYTWKDGKAPTGKKHKIISDFPYGIVRHPAAAAFLFFYWAVFPNFGTNHLVLASLWTVFIVVGTLLFEEGGLRGSDEFSTRYNRYANYVNAFVPSVWSIRKFLGILPAKEQVDFNPEK